MVKVMAVAAVAVLGLVGVSCGDDGGAAGPGPDEGAQGAGSDEEQGEDIVVEPLRPGSFGAVIPRPVSVTPGQGTFPLTAGTTLVVDEDANAAQAVELLQGYLGPVTGHPLPLVEADPEDEPDEVDDAGPRVIRFVAGDPDALGEEGYELRVAPDGVEVAAAAAPGFGWAVQTMRQLLPPEVEAGQPLPGTLALPAGHVQDQPRYRWRATMLDVARHFFPPEDVEQLIDMAAAYKLNVLHLHLSDDQGWRLQIEAYPQLTEIGASSAVGGDPGGFYTQDQYAGLVEYAAARGITIVPEIDMPGHTNAALASIPELNCDGQAPDLYTGMEVGFSSLCIDQELTYEFLDQVVGEVAALTPGPYIHIGGDESHATAPDDYRRFLQRAVEIVRSHGKVPIGWEEVANVDLGPDVVAQYWKVAENAQAAAAQGMDVIMSPAPRTYLDMKYNPSSPIGNDWAGLVDTRTAYEWDPQSLVPGLPPEAIVGLEAPLWTEFVTNRQELQQMMLPRLPGYAELGWSPAGGNSWDAYRQRLAAHAARWQAAGWAFTPDPPVPWPP